MIVTIPIKLDVDLNSRGASRLAAIMKTRKVAEQRATVRRAFDFNTRCRLAVFQKTNPIGRWTVTLTRIAPHTLDDDNLAGRLKAVRDETAKTLGIDDRDRDRLLFVYAQRKGGVREHAVEIRIQTRSEWLADEYLRVRDLVVEEAEKWSQNLKEAAHGK